MHMTQQIIWGLHAEVEQKCESVSSLSVPVFPFHVYHIRPAYCQDVTLTLDRADQKRDVMLSLWMGTFFFFCLLSSVLSSPPCFLLSSLSLCGASLSSRWLVSQQILLLTVWRHGNRLWKQHSHTNACLYTNRCEHVHSSVYLSFTQNTMYSTHTGI